MPGSKSEQTRHSNEEVVNFRTYGDARGPAWLADHPTDLAKAEWTLRSTGPESDLFRQEGASR